MNIAGFFKIFGLVLAGFVGLFAVIISYLFATGGFKPAYIPPEVIAFEYQEYIIDEDTEIFIYPTSYL
ncbi:MAG: hypothetical protein CVV59_01950 [Tenericutes bacterium HGW-Tenericutes-4]|nr:MAG: hypothetical protein CVV59_01950 [Tenericutes bacterium HGW-Tenericutes-4]